jgi:hypothetical protein
VRGLGRSLSEAAMVAVGTDPSRESAQRALMASYPAEGNRIEARRVLGWRACYAAAMARPVDCDGGRAHASKKSSAPATRGRSLPEAMVSPEPGDHGGEWIAHQTQDGSSLPLSRL